MTWLQLAAALTLLALGLRLTNLGARPLWLDEAFSEWFSDRSFHYLWNVLPTYEAHPPFYYSVLKLWRSIAGEGHAAMRGLSVLFGTLTVPLIMAIAREQELLSPSKHPLLRYGLAGFLAACSPMLMVVGQEARPYPMLVFAYSLAILGLLRLSRAFKQGEAGSCSSWLLFGLGAELTLWSHGLGVLYGLCLALAVLPRWLAGVDRHRLLRGLFTAAAVAILYIPCLSMMARRAADWSANWLSGSPSMLFQLVVLYTVPIQWQTLAGAMAMALLIKRALTLTYGSNGWNVDRSLLLLWLGPPVLAALISALFVPVFLARPLSATLVPAYLMMAAAISRSDNASERRIIVAAIGLALLPTALGLALRPAPERWDLASQYLSRNVGRADQVWLYPADSALPLDAAGMSVAGRIRAVPAPFPTLGIKGPIRAGWPAVVSVTPEQAAAFANDGAIKAAPVIWLVSRQSGIFDPGGDMPRALAKVRRAGRVQEWGYIAVQPFYAPGR